MAWNYFGGGTLVFGGNCKDGVQWLAKQMLIDLVSLRYEFTGWVDKVSDFYNDIDVYIQPSVSEGFGIEIIEAMAHGRPVIATTGTCGPDVITDGVEGFIVPPRDPMAILEKVRFFRDHPEKIAEMGGNARLRAKEYSWERIEERYVQFYKRILSPPVVMSR
jgi:glycosyltransferase involved in cell wall biosynthesis